MKMKAAVLVKTGDASTAFEVREVNRPVPGEGEVLIRTEAFGLNFADVMARKGLYREAPPLPSVLGYDVVGRIEAAGHGVENLHVGMRVAGMTRFGGYAEYCVTKATGVVQVPEEMDVIDATALGTQACTAYYASHMATNLFSGERVLVHAGAGGVGLFLIQLAKRRGCEVFATVGSDAKEQVARDFGADHVVNYRKADYEEEMNQLLRGQRLDVVFNAIAGTTFKKDQRLLGSGGRNVIYGAAERTSMQGGKFATMQLIFRMGLLIPILRMAKSQSIIGVNMLKIADHRAERIQEALKACVDLMIAGDLRVHGEVFHVDALADAHERLEKRETSGKVVIRW